MVSTLSRSRWRGVPLTLVVAILSSVLSRTVLSDVLPVRGAFYALTLTAVVYAAYAGGLRPGLVAATIGSVHALEHYMGLSGIFPSATDRATLAASVVVVTFVMAGMAGTLSERVERALREAREAAARLAEKNRELEEANRALREANETLEAFSFVVSHDLKEPVRAVDAYLDLAREEAESDEMRSSLDRALAANARLARLLSGLLELSRVILASGDAVARVSIVATLENAECRARFEHLLVERQGRLEVARGAADDAVLATPGAVSQILGNLVANALKHNPKPAPLVRVRVRREERFVETVVEDDGPGFPADAAQRARETETTGSPRSLRAGGFGFLIVHRAVRHLGGHVWVDRSAEGGAAVHFTLPRAP